MRKHWKIAWIIACAAAAMFAGCGEEQQPEGLTLAKVRAAYETVSQATKIEESIEIESGTLVQYTEEKEYSLAGDSYTVTGSSKRLNALDASEAYTETEIEAYTVNKAEAFTGAIGLTDANVENETVNENTLSVSVKAGKEKDFFKLQTLTDVSAMKAVFRMSEAMLGEIVVTYVSGASSVTVTIAFTY